MNLLDFEPSESTIDKINCMSRCMNAKGRVDAFKKIIDIAYFIVAAVISGKRIATIDSNDSVKIYNIKYLKKDL